MSDSLNTLVAQLRHFNAIDPKMQVSTVLAFLEIAVADRAGREINMQDLGKTIGFRSSAASRNVYYWADGHPQMAGGHQFVSVTINPENRRKRDLGLSVRGRRFAKAVAGEANGKEEGEPVAS